MFDIVERHWSAAPVDIVGIIQEVGIYYYEDILAPEESGLIERSVDGGYRIVVNAEHPLVRRRFTAAHELGHYTYHRNLIGKGISDNALYRSDNHLRYRNPTITQQHESEANRFAAIALMPAKLIKQLTADANLNLGNVVDVRRLAGLLGVSDQALRIRLKLPAFF